jgi:hypothetical protein
MRSVINTPFELLLMLLFFSKNSKYKKKMKNQNEQRDQI